MRLILIVLNPLALIADQGYGQARPYPPPQAIFSIATWEGREKALGKALQHYPLSDPALQKTIAQLLYREENDPEWQEMDESDHFRHYEEVLTDLNKKIALMYNNKMAWHALVWVNYAPDSVYADWLIHQPQAVQLILKMFEDPREVPQGNASIMLGILLGECGTKPEIATCSEVEPQREHILSVIHQRILDSPDQRKGFSIEALGYCGSETDMALLQRLIDQQNAKKVTPEEKTAFTIQKTVIFLCRRAQAKILQREASAKQQ